MQLSYHIVREFNIGIKLQKDVNKEIQSINNQDLCNVRAILWISKRRILEHLKKATPGENPICFFIFFKDKGTNF